MGHMHPSICSCALPYLPGRLRMSMVKFLVYAGTWRWTRPMAFASSTTSPAPSAARPTTLSCSGSPAAPAAPSSPASPTRSVCTCRLQLVVDHQEQKAPCSAVRCTRGHPLVSPIDTPTSLSFFVCTHAFATYLCKQYTKLSFPCFASIMPWYLLSLSCSLIR